MLNLLLYYFCRTLFSKVSSFLWCYLIERISFTFPITLQTPFSRKSTLSNNQIYANIWELNVELGPTNVIWKAKKKPMAQRKGLWRQIFSNFINSLKPRKYWGELRGTDYMGTDYYEGPERMQGSLRRSRWFIPSKPDNFEQEIPPEWEAWLTYKRKEPPTEEEISFNIQQMKMRIENAQKIEKTKTPISNNIETYGKLGFPKYKDVDSEFKTSQKRKDQQ